MADLIKIRRDTAANWSVANPVLDDGEIGYEKDTRILKVGDGVTHWNDLRSLKIEELEERVGSLERAAGQHNVLPFDSSLSLSSVTPSDTLYEHIIQPREVFEYSICLIPTLGSVRFCLKVGIDYYNKWSIKKQFNSDGLIPVGHGSIDEPYSVPTGTYTEEISNNDWYSGELYNKVFYNRSNKVVYAYNCETKSLEAMTNIQVVEENAPEDESTSNPNNAPKGSIIVDIENDKLLTWNGSKWKALSGGGINYDLVKLNKNLGDITLSDVAVSNDNKLVFRDRTTADGGKNVVILRKNLVTGKLHKATLIVADDAMLPNPVGAASETPSKNNNIRITLDGVTYEVILANTTSIAVDSNDTTNTINNLYTEGKYIAKRLSDNFLSNIYNMTTKKIRVPYTSEYIVDDGVQKVVFTKCELTDEDVAESSIVIKKYGSSSFVTDNEMFTLTDEIINDVEVNVLTQEMITPEGKDMTNTVFKVQIDYDLQGQEIVIPQGCVIEIDGGSISNGYLRGNETMCNDFSAINAELIGTWRNNDNERIDNGVRRARKKDVKLSTYFYVGQHGAIENRKVDIYRYTKKVGMGDVNMVIAFQPNGILSQENKALWFMPYQTIRYPQSDTTQIPTTITVNSPVYLGLEEINESGETVPVELVPDTAREEDGKYIVEWGNADLIGLGLFLRQGIDTLSFVKFVHYCSDIYNVNNTEGELTIMKLKNTADFEARYVDRLKDFGFNFDTVYVMNEPTIGTYRADGEDTDTSKGSIYGSPERKAIVVNSVIEDLIEPMREKGYKVGATLSQLYQYYNCIDEIFNALDEAGLNHYPTLSYDDDNLADTDDLSEYNIIGIRNVLQQNMKRKKMPLFITEGGCGYWKNALRAPMTTRMNCAANYGGDNRLDRDYSIPGHIFFKSLFKAAAALDAKKVNIWFPNNLETSNVEEVILNCFYK